MKNARLTLRAAEPIFEEGLACARYLDAAAEGFHTFMLGRRAPELLAAAYAEPNHSYSFENVTFAERDGRIVGMVLGFTGERHSGFSDQPLKEVEGYPALRVTVVRTLMAPLFRILETIRDGDYYLLAIAIDEDARRQGVATALMDFAEDQARAERATRLSLDVSADNVGARRLYERRGMTIESRWPRRLRLPGLSLYRMSKRV